MAFLEGYRVLDLSDHRGLMAGRILADMGADVVQVEPPEGSPARRHELMPANGKGASYLWQAYAANKRGVAIDATSPEGRAQLAALIGAADVLIESAGPKAMAALGLDWDQLRAAHPKLVYVSITPFGRTGPKADYAESDLVVWAAGGPLDPHREGDYPPVRPSIPQAYRQAGADAAAGALLALIARRATGRGQLVDVSAQACLGISTLASSLAHANNDIPREMGGGVEFKKRVDQSGSGSGSSPESKKWKCRDGLIEFHIGVGPAAGAFTTNFFKWMESEGAPVAKFAALDWRLVPQMMESGDFPDEDVDEARAAVRAFLADKTKEEVLMAAVKHKLLAVPIYTTADLADSTQLKARDFYITLGTGDRATRLPGPAAKLTMDGYALRHPAPLLGEHNAEVLREWGAAAPVQTEGAR